MAGYRVIGQSVWNDDSFLALSPEGKLLFLYLLSGPAQSCYGVFERSPEMIANDLSLPVETVNTLLGHFETKNMLFRQKFWIAVLFFPEHQSSKLNVKLQAGLRDAEVKWPTEVRTVCRIMWWLENGPMPPAGDPPTIPDRVSDRVSDRVGDRLRLGLNLNSDDDGNGTPPTARSAPPSPDANPRQDTTIGQDSKSGSAASVIDPLVQRLADSYAATFLARPSFGLKNPSAPYDKFMVAAAWVKRLTSTGKFTEDQMILYTMGCLKKNYADKTPAPGNLADKNETFWTQQMPIYLQEVTGSDRPVALAAAQRAPIVDDDPLVHQDRRASAPPQPAAPVSQPAPQADIKGRRTLSPSATSTKDSEACNIGDL